jgi:hypothetical protein
MLHVRVSTSGAPLTSSSTVGGLARAQRDCSSAEYSLADMALPSRIVEPPGLTPRLARAELMLFDINQNPPVLRLPRQTEWRQSGRCGRSGTQTVPLTVASRGTFEFEMHGDQRSVRTTSTGSEKSE